MKYPGCKGCAYQSGLDRERCAGCRSWRPIGDWKSTTATSGEALAIVGPGIEETNDVKDYTAEEILSVYDQPDFRRWLEAQAERMAR